MTHPLLPVALAALAFGPVLNLLGDVRSAWWRRLALLAALVLLVRYAVWRFSGTVPWGEASLAALYMQTIAVLEILFIVLVVQSLAFFALEPSRPSPTRGRAGALRRASVDVFIATYDEGPEILERTVLAAQRIEWGGPLRVHVLDDTRREWVRQLCEQVGARWITRADHHGAKAGNLNHALGVTEGEFILVLDADFIAHPDAVRRLIAAMTDERTAVAQARQHFYNADPVARHLGTEGSASDDQALFFDRILPARDRGGFAFFCGTCALLRRAALVEAGGVPTGSVTEDIVLSVRLRQLGWVSRLVDTRVATGLAPEGLTALFAQRQRWARGAIQMLYMKSGPLGRGLRLRDRLAFLPVYWLVSPLLRVATLVIPQLFLLFGWQPLVNAGSDELLRYQIPLFVALAGLAAFLFHRRWVPFVSAVWEDVIALRILPQLLFDAALPFRRSHFNVTPKGRALVEASGGGRVLGAVVVVLVLVTLAALLVGVIAPPEVGALVPLSLVWAAINLVRLLAALVVLWRERPRGLTELAVDLGAGDGVVLLAGTHASPVHGWTLTESRLIAPEHRTLGGLVLAARAPSGRIHRLADLTDDGTLRPFGHAARARLLALLVQLVLDREPPYRPGRALATTLVEMFGLSFRRKPQ
ncbi:MAG: glycosyltransferase [Burkholderiaceae bacterium]